MGADDGEHSCRIINFTSKIKSQFEMDIQLT